jgi:predicted nucleic acid-binding protein
MRLSSPWAVSSSALDSSSNDSFVRRSKSRALDLIIAATALEYGLTLVTNNTDDFKDINPSG